MCCFLTLIFWGSGLDFGRSWANLGPNLGPDPQVKCKKSFFFRYLGPTWANLGQKAAPGRPERPKMRSKSVPRQPKWDQKASQDSQNEAKMCHRTFTFWWPAVPSFKRGGFQGSAQEAPKRPQEGPKRFQEASKRWFWEILAFILADVWLFLAMLFNHCLSARDERLGWLRNRLIFHFLFFKCEEKKTNGGF